MLTVEQVVAKPERRWKKTKILLEHDVNYPRVLTQTDTPMLRHIRAVNHPLMTSSRTLRHVA